jgi:hypothetical protein
VSGARSLALAWYGGLLGGLLPILLLGFLYSALADRTVFALWALVLGAFWVVALREGLGAGWTRLRLLGALALLLAAGLAVFAWLELRHHEILDLGFRAVFPAVYHPRATAPGTVGVLAGVLGVIGGVCLVLAKGPHLPGPPLPRGEEGEKQDREGQFPSLPLGERGQGSEGHGAEETV